MRVFSIACVVLSQPDQVVAVLQLATKVAAQSKVQYGATGRVRDAAYLGAFVEVLNATLRFWDCGVTVVDERRVQELIDRVQADLEAGVQPDAATARRWHSTLSGMAASAQQPHSKERYSKLKLPQA